MPVTQNSSSAARQIAALIQCHECMVRYSSILRREFIASLFSAYRGSGGNRARTLHEKNSYLQLNTYLIPLNPLAVPWAAVAGDPRSRRPAWDGGNASSASF